MPTRPPAVALVAAAALALKERADEVNRLNVFPVPDGDTGTNMSLTMDAVMAELDKLSADATLSDVCKGVTHGSLMGARGNSGVILSQILRGLCESLGQAEEMTPDAVSHALERSVEVAFQAVRKPVEGTMLTVLKDSAKEAKASRRAGDSLDEMLQRVANAAFDSVQRTPELLPVLRENNVVDAGGFGLAILAEGLIAAHKGEAVEIRDVSMGAMPSLAVEPADDWDDDEYLYCTEFLLLGADVDKSAVEEFVSAAGGSELVVGEGGTLKVHVHTDDPGSVLSFMTGVGQVAEVHINNMRAQTESRAAALRANAADGSGAGSGPRAYGIVTVAAGDGLKEILSSLGADVIVNGGQTMNPSTAELLEAAASLNAEKVIFLPNNKNIVMAAQQAAEHVPGEAGVVPTRSVPEAFAALLEFDPDAGLDTNVDSMTAAASEIRTGEVTRAIKDSKGKAGPIKTGDIIGITEGEIEVIGSDLLDVASRLVAHMQEGGEALTILGGADLSDEEVASIAASLSVSFPDLEVESHRGGQPLYPLIISVE